MVEEQSWAPLLKQFPDSQEKGIWVLFYLPNPGTPDRKVFKNRREEMSQHVVWNLEASKIELEFTITESRIVFTQE